MSITSTTSTNAMTFAARVTTDGDALEMARLIGTALQDGVVEDFTGKSLGYATDSLYRFFLRRPMTALERDHQMTLATLHALGFDRGYALAAACAHRSDQLRVVAYWAGVSEELLAESSIAA